MASIHFVCRRELNLHVVKHPVYESGDWDVTREDAERLVGGMLYLHETKADASYFGGQISAYRVVETDRAHSDRVIFTVRSMREAKEVRWSGIDHGRASNSGVIDD